MGMLLTIMTVCGLFLAVSFLVVFRKLVRDQRALPAEDDGMESVSGDRYRPLERLLNNREYALLQAHPQFNRHQARHFRCQRVEAFRGYLSCLSRDYGRVCNAIREVMVQSPADRSDLASLLLRQRAIFTLRLMMAEFRLSLIAFGVNVDVHDLVAALDRMQTELQQLLAAIQPPPVIHPSAA